MTCHILGLGPSIHDYKPDGNFSIGCNDSFRYHPSNYLICVSRLSPERTRVVMDSRPEKLLAYTGPFVNHPAYQYIAHSLPTWRMDRENRLDQGIIWSSNNTPFIACVVAHNLGYKEIVMWGVDFIEHPLIKDGALEVAKSHFLQLYVALSKIGTSLYLGNAKSCLSLPLWHQSPPSISG